jgi:hypothetical protein
MKHLKVMFLNYDYELKQNRFSKGVMVSLVALTGNHRTYQLRLSNLSLEIRQFKNYIAFAFLARAI